MAKEFGQLLSNEEIDAAVAEYELNVDAVAAEFKERTRLQDADAAFVFVATALQILRIVLIQAMRPEEQKAGAKNKFENELHDKQNGLFKRFQDHEVNQGDRLYAPFAQIIGTPGVPYDATRYQGKKLDILKGANHRFMTLGHDPLLGLVFGTSNILTNTITTLQKTFLFGVPTIETHVVAYDPMFGTPMITGRSVGAVELLHDAGERLEDDKRSVAAAFIKQIIHIGTDVYTPKGIQLPLSGLVLTNKSVERLTAYVGTAEIADFAVSAGLATLINWVIASLHGCTLVFQDDGTDFCSDLYQARTRKIISLSNLIASTSNVIAAAVKPDVVRLDIGGLAVTLYRLLSDTAFITKLKYEFLNSEVSKLYEAKGDGLVEADWLDESACLARLGLN